MTHRLAATILAPLNLLLYLSVYSVFHVFVYVTFIYIGLYFDFSIYIKSPFHIRSVQRLRFRLK